jgi:nitrogen regulatory protein P-II 2
MCQPMALFARWSEGWEQAGSRAWPPFAGLDPAGGVKQTFAVKPRAVRQRARVLLPSPVGAAQPAASPWRKRTRRLRVRRPGRADAMKLITAIIKPSRLDAVVDAVTDAGASGLTVTEVRGYGRQKGKTEVYRGAEYAVKLLPKVKIEAAVPTDVVDAVVEALAAAANTGKIGDGKVFVTDLEQALRIRTGERDAAAITG